ncbi:ubiquitin fusion degradation protein 1 homolog [Tripterygium wilfordii]|nr:ubiquitin fusion degradation protein 1 homolog [Tripterygium wilfordii]
MPDWMMRNMKLLEGETVVVKNVSVRKGTYMKLQPHSTDFINLTNPKSVLETTLRSFSCLTTGDTVMILYNNHKYQIDVVETKPSSAICVIETDCEVDFAPPLDYKEPEKPVKREDDDEEEDVKKKKGLEENKFKAFTGIARRLDGSCSIIKNESDDQIVEANNVMNKSSTDQSNLKVPMSRKLVFNSNVVAGKEEAKSANNGEEKFQAFTGRSYKLN